MICIRRAGILLIWNSNYCGQYCTRGFTITFEQILTRRPLAFNQRARGLRSLASRREHFRDAKDRRPRSEEHTSELQSRENLVCRLLLEKKNNKKIESQ